MFHFECNRAYLNFHCDHTQSFELRAWLLWSFEYDLSETPSATLPLQRSYEYARSEASSRLVRSQWSFEYSIEASLQEYLKSLSTASSGSEALVARSDESVVSIGYVQICQVSAVVEINEDSQWMKRSLWDRVFVLDGPLLDHHRQEEDSAKKSTSEVSQLSIAYES